jgi:PAS domain S-box-containing protein
MKPHPERHPVKKKPAPPRGGARPNRIDFEDLITDISTEFINLAPEEVDRGIRKALQKVGRFAGADRSYVFLLRNSHADNTHEWCARGVPRQRHTLQALSAEAYPWFVNNLRRMEAIHVSSTRDLPEEARAEREVMEARGAKSFMAVPMILNNSLVGFLGFDSVRKEQNWTEDTAALLRIVGEIFVSALERKRADEVLKESEKRYRELVDNSLAGIYITQDHILQFCNRTFARIFGYARPEDLAGMHVQKLVAPESWALLDAQVKLCETVKMAPARLEITALKTNGSAFDAEVLGTRIIFDGNPAIQSTIIDITERKRVEESLRESEKKYRALFEDVPVGLYRTTPEGSILDVNPTMVQMLGFTEKDSVLGKNASEFYYDPGDREKSAALLDSDKVLRNFEFRLKQANGRVMWVQDNVHAVFAPNGRVLYYEGSLLDFTRLKLEEETLKRRADQVISHQRALLALAQMDLSNLRGALKVITEMDAETLDVERVSIWFWNAENTGFVCFDLHKRTDNAHESGATLEANGYPFYFQSLRESRIIPAHDAGSDPRMSEFPADYLKSAGISSIMDVPVRHQGRVFGIVRHEHTGPGREWTLEEQQFAISIGDVVTLALEASERKRKERINESIFKISEATNSSRNLEELFRSIHKVISSLMPANNFYIALYDSLLDSLSFPYFVDEFDQTPAPKKLGKGLTEYVLRTGKPLLASPEVFTELENQNEVESIGAPSIDWLGVPLIIDGKTIGVLVVQTYTEGVRYGGEEKNILKFVSDQVAMAVHRKKTEEEVQERERFLSSVFESIQDGISILDEDYRIIRVNWAMEKWYSHAMPLVGKRCYEAYHLQRENCPVCPTRKTLETRQAAYEVIPKIGKGGETTGWLDLYSFPLIDQKTGQMKGVIEYVRDITERKKAEDGLQASLREKEVLLREVHHRVKNNMQVISSLLNLQSRHVQDGRVLDMFKESQRRIRSMALIHERLYQSSDLSRIEFSQYLRNLATHLFHSYQVDSSRVRLHLDAEEVFLNINTAIPCGLIVNELVSNALKHGFPDGRTGEVGLELHRVAGDGYRLRVRDDGVGFPEGLDFRRTETLGMQIIVTLVSQIDASIELRRERGVEFEVVFQEVKYSQRT